MPTYTITIFRNVVVSVNSVNCPDILGLVLRDRSYLSTELSCPMLLFTLYFIVLCLLYCCFVFSMKTGLLKWKPDYEGASLEYGKAGSSHLYLNAVQCCVM